jgi:ribonuclease HI
MQQERSYGYKKTTNNRMEILAALHGLHECMNNPELMDGCNLIKVHSDSTYVVDAIAKNWLLSWVRNSWITYGSKQPVKNQDLWEDMIDLLNKLRERNVQYQFIHVRGHRGHEYNEQCDKLAKSAASGDNLLEVDARETK